MKYRILTPLFIATTLVYSSQIFAMEIPDNHPTDPSDESITTSSQTITYTVIYKDKGNNTHESSPLTYEEMLLFVKQKNEDNLQIIQIKRSEGSNYLVPSEGSRHTTPDDSQPTSDDRKKYKYSPDELTQKHHIRNFIVVYKEPNYDTHHSTSLTQQELTDFIQNIRGRTILEIKLDKPIYPYKLYDSNENIPRNFIVTYKSKDSHDEKQTQPLTQEQLQNFLAANHGFLIVGIKTNEMEN